MRSTAPRSQIEIAKHPYSSRSTWIFQLPTSAHLGLLTSSALAQDVPASSRPPIISAIFRIFPLQQALVGSAAPSVFFSWLASKSRQPRNPPQRHASDVDQPLFLA